MGDDSDVGDSEDNHIFSVPQHGHGRRVSDSPVAIPSIRYGATQGQEDDPVVAAVSNNPLSQFFVVCDAQWIVEPFSFNTCRAAFSERGFRRPSRIPSSESNPPCSIRTWPHACSSGSRPKHSPNFQSCS